MLHESQHVSKKKTSKIFATIDNRQWSLDTPPYIRNQTADNEVDWGGETNSKVGEDHSLDRKSDGYSFSEIILIIYISKSATITTDRTALHY